MTPLKPAIERGTTDIVVIACQPENMGSSSFGIKYIIRLIERVFDVISNAIVDDDMGLVEFLNRKLPDDGTAKKSVPLSGYRKVKVRVIRPSSPIGLDIRNFSAADIEKMIGEGCAAGKEVVALKSESAANKKRAVPLYTTRLRITRCSS